MGTRGREGEGWNGLLTRGGASTDLLHGGGGGGGGRWREGETCQIL